jgi:hypothetical protein
MITIVDMNEVRAYYKNIHHPAITEIVMCKMFIQEKGYTPCLSTITIEHNASVDREYIDGEDHDIQTEWVALSPHMDWYIFQDNDHPGGAIIIPIEERF